MVKQPHKSRFESGQCEVCGRHCTSSWWTYDEDQLQEGWWTCSECYEEHCSGYKINTAFGKEHN